MTTLFIQLHDITILATHNQAQVSGAVSIVLRNANRVIENDPEIGPARFVAGVISELVQDSRFNGVHVQSRFDIVNPVPVLELSFETGTLRFELTGETL